MQAGQQEVYECSQAGKSDKLARGPLYAEASDSWAGKAVRMLRFEGRQLIDEY